MQPLAILKKTRVDFFLPAEAEDRETKDMWREEHRWEEDARGRVALWCLSGHSRSKEKDYD